MLFEIENATVSLGGETILSHVSFAVRWREKIALVGDNGAGKTTLLRLIAGEIEPDRDDKARVRIEKAGNPVIGMLRQITEPESLGLTVDELMAREAPPKEENEKEWYDFRAEYDRIFTGFGFSLGDRSRRLCEFSGGEQTRISFIRLLLLKPDILLLDEPTNHLDLKACEWLEEYLRTYPKAVVMVSHDRYFLDRAAQFVVEVRGGKLYRYAGNYSSFRREREQSLYRQRKAYEDQQEEIRRQEELIRRFRNKPRKAAFARSRKQLLSRMDLIEKPDIGSLPPAFPEITPAVIGSRHVLEADRAGIGYDRKLYELSLRLNRGQRLAVTGDNGVGKTALLKTVCGQLKVLGGHMHLGNQIRVGYFDQQTAALAGDGQTTVLELFRGHFPLLSDKDARSRLARFAFRGRDAGKPVGSLSGGERVRLALAVLLEDAPNFLVLDEPTNHCDIQTQEVVERALLAYKGTILFVSHDRFLVRELATALLLIGKGEAAYYPFGYGHYLEHRKQAGTPQALMSTQNQALIEGLRAVPRRTYLPSREISTGEAYADWRLAPIEEELERCRKAAEEAYAAREKELGDLMASEEAWAEGSAAEDTAAGRALYDALEAWTKAALAWYDEINDLGIPM